MPGGGCMPAGGDALGSPAGGGGVPGGGIPGGGCIPGGGGALGSPAGGGVPAGGAPGGGCIPGGGGALGSPAGGGGVPGGGMPGGGIMPAGGGALGSPPGGGIMPGGGCMPGGGAASSMATCTGGAADTPLTWTSPLAGDTKPKTVTRPREQAVAHRLRWRGNERCVFCMEEESDTPNQISRRKNIHKALFL